ncbi:transmembrane protein 238-like [Lethenteron reissneri]|uniref:transmembrane protein 238-like n=1 Tax=Lethenteron reissneri TaxID=7753 RepID=UPI002AB6C91D|nr:transmembrane protein 238-like [Lethenteron reissneri]XP_061433170.1 transmembrane protein 238-like [Lethenteron reissneri]
MAECSNRSLGRCAWAFVLALVFDVVGLVMILVGIFANTVAYYDFLIYTGAIIVFLSIIWWLFWFMGNITATESKYDRVAVTSRSFSRPWVRSSRNQTHQHSKRAPPNHHHDGPPNGSHHNQSFSNDVAGVKNGALPAAVVASGGGPARGWQQCGQDDTAATAF